MILSIEFLRLVDTGELAPANHLTILNQKSPMNTSVFKRKRNKSKTENINKKPAGLSNKIEICRRPLIVCKIANYLHLCIIKKIV